MKVFSGNLLISASFAILLGCATEPDVDCLGDCTGVASPFPPRVDIDRIVNTTDYIGGQWLGAVYFDRSERSHVLAVKPGIGHDAEDVLVSNDFSVAVLDGARASDSVAAANMSSDAISVGRGGGADSISGVGELGSAAGVSDTDDGSVSMRCDLYSGCKVAPEVFFPLNVSSLSTDMMSALSRLEMFSGASIEIIGYADAVGAAKYNENLAYQRATSVSEYLRGIGFTKIKIRSAVESEYEGQAFRKVIIVGL